MKFYVFASKSGTEVLLGRGEVAFVVPSQDLATHFGSWLMKRGWEVRLSDSTEQPEPLNTAQGNVAVSYLVKQFAEEVGSPL